MSEVTDGGINNTNYLPQQIPPAPEMTEKKQVIDGIISQDREAFTLWTQNPNNKFRLDLPHAAARYLTIPSRVFELADDPLKIDIHLLLTDVSEMRAVVYERKDNPITDEKSLKTYLDSIDDFLNKRDTRNIRFPKIPPDVDYLHAHLARLGYKDKFQLNDLIINEIFINGIFPPVLNVDSYDSRHDFNNKGVATSFYRRLEQSARDMGYRFITGYNNPDNIDFFKKKLGRSSLDEVQKDLRHLLHPVTHASKYPEHFTVDFLYPEDKTEFIIPNSHI